MKRPFPVGTDAPYVEMNKELLTEEKVTKGELIASLDASFLSKSGKQTEGLGSFWNGSVARSEKGLEVSSIAVIDIKANTAYHFDSAQTQPSSEEGARVCQYCQQIVRVAQPVKEFRREVSCHRWLLHETANHDFNRGNGAKADW